MLESGAPFDWGRHHGPMCDFADAVIDGKIERGIINVPPGYTKTRLLVVMLSARAFARNSRARIMHVSASDALVQTNSKDIKDVMASEQYRENFGIDLRQDTKAAGRWKTTGGGEFFAVPSRGTITGMRAGRIPQGGETFTGALLIDDILKAQDADSRQKSLSGAELKAVIARYHSTLKTRLIPPTTPILIVMQRLHVDDLSGHLLRGGSGEKWHHLMLPIEILPGDEYPAEFTHGIPWPHDLPPGPLWDRIHNEAAIDQLREPAHIFAAQYRQRPMRGTGNLFKAHHFRPWSEPGDLLWRRLYADTAQKQEEQNDFTVIQAWGKRASDGKAIFLDQVKERVDADGLLSLAETMWKKHSAFNGPHMGKLTSIKVEDKVSGTGLIQQLSKRGVPVEAVERGRDKVSRANDVIPSFAAGLVEHPPEKIAPWVSGWRDEMLAFPQTTYDDQCDPTFDAVADICLGDSFQDWL